MDREHFAEHREHAAGAARAPGTRQVRVVPEVVWTPISLGPLLKMSHLGSDSACST